MVVKSLGGWSKAAVGKIKNIGRLQLYDLGISPNKVMWHLLYTKACNQSVEV